MCNNCYCALMRSKKAMDSGRQYNPSIKVFQWIAYSPSECTVCDHFENAHTGGRPKKKQHSGRPASISTRTAVDHICSVAPPCFFLPDTHTSVALLPESAHIPCVSCVLDCLTDQYFSPCATSWCTGVVCVSIYKKLRSSSVLAAVVTTSKSLLQ